MKHDNVILRVVSTMTTLIARLTGLFLGKYEVMGMPLMMFTSNGSAWISRRVVEDILSA